MAPRWFRTFAMGPLAGLLIFQTPSVGTCTAHLLSNATNSREALFALIQYHTTALCSIPHKRTVLGLPS